jgi:hypothetical protein
LLSNDSKFTLLINSENTPPELKLLFEHLQALGQES